jgi:hypothetical protein
MPGDSNQAELDFAEVWRAVRSDDIAASDVGILKTIGAFCGVGLVASLVLAILGLDIVGFF